MLTITNCPTEQLPSAVITINPAVITYVRRSTALGALAVTPTTIPGPPSATPVATNLAVLAHLTGLPRVIAPPEDAIIPALGPFFNDPGMKTPAVKLPVTSSGQASPLGPDHVKE